jgi:RHS repeat-associated protein
VNSRPFHIRLITGHSWARRLLALTLVASQVVPTFAFTDEKPAKRPSTPAAAQVVPNRKAPPIIPAPRTPQFSAAPTDAEISRARAFDEPLLPLPGPMTGRENVELAHAISARMGSATQGLEGFETFLRDHLGSRWKGSLLLGMGVSYRRTGYYTRALDSWEQAWGLLKGETDPRLRALADRAVGELAELNARLGRYDRLEQLFASIEGRDVRGPAAEKVSAAREGFATMQNEPERAFLCGPYGLDRILASVRKDYVRDPKIADAKSTRQGTSMRQMLELADSVGMKMQIARRTPGAAVVVPALVHWKAGHFAALVKEVDGRLLIQDPTFGDDLWVDKATLDDEASGYFLVRAGTLPLGWEALTIAAGDGIWGKGSVNSASPQFQGSCPKVTSAPICMCNAVKKSKPRMADYTVNLLLVNLHIEDSPVGYDPPVGPEMEFTVAYNGREVFQPQLPAYSNLGPKWTFDWFSFVQDDPDPAHAAQNVDVYLRGGGQETYSGMGSGTSGVHYRSRAIVARTSSTSYERRLPDGSVEVFGQPDAATVFPRRIYLTAIKDPQGNSVSLAYSYESTTGGLRLATATDAIGQITTFSYENSDPLKITKVTDPFGRFAQFEYDTSGRLNRITDVIGITSEFTYGTSDIISSLTTPYGTTSFAVGQNGVDRWLETTDPVGARERFEFLPSTSPILATEPVVPQGMATYNEFIHARNTFYFDKRAMAAMPMGRDYTKAHIYHWLHFAANTGIASGTLESEKAPLERRVWYNYPDQPLSVEGSSVAPSIIGRVLDDGTTQLYRYEYNSKGKVIKETDPLGRETVYVYGTGSTPDADQASGTGIDLIQVKQKNGTSYDVLASFTYNSQHLPLTSMDAAGKTATYAFNPRGQLLTVETPARAGITESRTTTYAYDTNGYLQSITGPATGATASFTYDGYGRLRTVTDSEGYVVTHDYDALDRPTRITYPDTTSEETVYNKLDAEKQRDRLGRWAYTFYDALRRPVATRDSAGRTTTMQWCSCGSMDKLVDGKNNATSWERDLQGRITKEIRSDDSVREYTYENTTSRVKKVKDAKAQDTQYTYRLDNRLQQVSYPTAQIATPTVSFTYEVAFPRLAMMVDGTGSTSFTYHPIGATPPLGAGRLATVDGPYASDTNNYAYDELGRVVSRTLNGVTSTWSYDPLGRLSSQGDPIGTFTYAYVGATRRVQSVTYPNGQLSTYTYLPNVGDQRLQEIHHKTSASGSTLSRFTYAYDAVGNIKTWTQQYGATANAYDLGYDPADQLTTATYHTTDPTPSLLKRYAYSYDAAGNRTTEQTDDAPVISAFDSANRLVSQDGGGRLAFKGTVNEPSTVTVQGEPAFVAPDNRFEGKAQVTVGTNTVAVMATDASGNTRTNSYHVNVAAAAKTFGYDANGSLTSNGTKTYEWDGDNRLVRVLDNAIEVARFTYDGLGRRATKTSSGVTRTYVYAGKDIVEERLSSGATIRTVHGPRIDNPLASISGGTASYYLADHLGSIVQVTDGSTAVTLTRQYDMYGTQLLGATAGGYAFTGREWDPETALYYYRARYYDPRLGRFVSEDPIGLRGAINRYSYVNNAPLNWTDPDGTCPVLLVPLAAEAMIYAITATAAVVTAWYGTKAIADTAAPLMNKAKDEREEAAREERDLDKVKNKPPERAAEKYRPDPTKVRDPKDLARDPVEDLANKEATQREFAKRGYRERIRDLGKSKDRVGKTEPE